MFSLVYKPSPNNVRVFGEDLLENRSVMFSSVETTNFVLLHKISLVCQRVAGNQDLDEYFVDTVIFNYEDILKVRFVVDVLFFYMFVWVILEIEIGYVVFICCPSPDLFFAAIRFAQIQK